MRKVLRLCMMLTLALMLVSCSAERRGISQMRTLTAQIERQGSDYSVNEWKDAYYRFKAIDDSMDSSKLTPSQRSEYSELKARCVKSFAKSSVKAVKDGISDYIREGVDVVKGIIDAVLE